MSDRTRRMVTLRIDEDVLDAYKADGPGYQLRMNDDLRKAKGLDHDRA